MWRIIAKDRWTETQRQVSIWNIAKDSVWWATGGGLLEETLKPSPPWTFINLYKHFSPACFLWFLSQKTPSPHHQWPQGLLAEPEPLEVIETIFIFWTNNPFVFIQTAFEIQIHHDLCVSLGCIDLVTSSKQFSKGSKCFSCIYVLIYNF